MLYWKNAKKNKKTAILCWCCEEEVSGFRIHSCPEPECKVGRTPDEPHSTALASVDFILQLVLC